MKEKFVFSNKGIHLVSQKVGEADYFLGELKRIDPHDERFNYVFSAFVSALRSITFSLQFVMKEYPNFDEWYKRRQEVLRKSSLAKAFVEFRNHAQKTGIIPIMKRGSLFEGIFYHSTQFYVPTSSDIKKVPSGTVVELSHRCLVEIIVILDECYTDYDVYVNPPKLFSKKALEELNWKVEDIEEFVGFPRGYTNMDFEDEELDNTTIRLNLLKRHSGDETLQFYLDKYLKEENEHVTEQ
jgi:hypothetical protein